MALSLKKSSCVAVGTFNIYLIQPNLLTQMDVVAKGQKVAISGDLTQPGLRFEIADTLWTVRPERLSIESTQPSVHGGDMMSSTLKCLCWTPLMAIGMNCTYASAGDVEIPAAMRLPVVSGAANLASHFAIKKDDGLVVNCQLVQTKEETEVNLNVHLDFSKLRTEKDQLELNKRACDFFAEFEVMRDMAIEVATEALGEGFLS